MMGITALARTEAITRFTVHLHSNGLHVEAIQAAAKNEFQNSMTAILTAQGTGQIMGRQKNSSESLL